MKEAPNEGSAKQKKRVCVRDKLPIEEFARIEAVGRTEYDLIAERG
jgi:hypothetical protein